MIEVERSDIQYTRSGDVAIAYQVAGRGPLDLVYVPFAVSNLFWLWQHPVPAAAFSGLASFSRLILLDKRGSGLSDRPRDVPTLETRMDDIGAVMDAVGSERAVLFGSIQGGQLCALFAATYPERTAALVLFNTMPRAEEAPNYPWGATRAELNRTLREVREGWGTRAYLEGLWMEMLGGLQHDESLREWFIAYQRLAASPGAAHAFQRMWADTDIRDVLHAIRVPTLVLYGPKYAEVSRYVAEQIPDARAVPLATNDNWVVPATGALPEIERFVRNLGEEAEADRVLATVLFTDIVGATERAATLGDRRWRALLDAHNAEVRRQLARFRGRELDTAGDGFFATFDGPARAIHCASAIAGAVRDLGIEVRVGVHTGECELMNGKVGGIAVHIGARVAAKAAPGEVLVSQTVKDLVAGSGIEFEERGAHELKGVPGEWRLYAVSRA